MIAMIPRALKSLVLLVATCICWDCVNGGGGSDTETFSGVVQSDMGVPLARVRVKVIPITYDPSNPTTGAIRYATTDTAGRFSVQVPDDTGAYYNVIAGKREGMEWGMTDSLKVADTALVELSAAKVFLITLHDAGYSERDSGIAFFPGTDILTRCTPAEAARIDSVPFGIQRIKVESQAGWEQDSVCHFEFDTVYVRANKDGMTLRSGQ